MDKIVPETSSFKERDARVFIKGGKVYRALSKKAFEQWQAVKNSKAYTQLLSDGKIIDTIETKLNVESFIVDDLEKEKWVAFLEHKKVPFVSYPYEWSFYMLKDAALLHLSIMEAILPENLILQDATPFNVQWIGIQPVFIDISSFYKRKEGEPWMAYSQFCSTFLYPLMLQAYKGIRFNLCIRNVKGIPINEFYKLFSSVEILLKKGVFKHVYLLGKIHSQYLKKRKKEKKSQLFFTKEMILHNLRSLKKLISKLQCKRDSLWSSYTSYYSYDESAIKEKKNFVSEVISKRKWKLVWDLGCNVGDFSILVAPYTNYTVAIDSDTTAIDTLYIKLQNRQHTNILPIVVDITDPSPNLGWNLQERKNLHQRGKPDLILALALIHHLVIGENIRLDQLIKWFSSITRNIVIEFVDRKDEMVQLLLTNREDIFWDYKKEIFEKILGKYFKVEKKTEIKEEKHTHY